MKLSAVRLKALASWQSHTKRETTDGNPFDYYADSHECDWQDKASDLGFSHISFFCSLGTFNSHITELLTDYRFDNLEFDEGGSFNSEIIFRYYERIFLVASQSLEDFEYMIGVILSIKETKKKRASLDKEVDYALGFINNIIKHKKKHFHACNHHINFIFEDFRPNLNNPKALSWRNPLDSYSEVYVPKLEKIISCLLSCYDKINSEFKDEQKFEKFCKQFEETRQSANK